MADESGRCRCGNEYVCVIERTSGTTVYCPECGRQTTRLARESAIRAWNERAKGKNGGTIKTSPRGGGKLNLAARINSAPLRKEI